MNATDIEHGSAAELVCMSGVNNEGSGRPRLVKSNFADDYSTVSTAESAVSKSAQSSTRMKRAPKFRDSLQRRLSMERMPLRLSSSEIVHSLSEGSSEEVKTKQNLRASLQRRLSMERMPLRLSSSDVHSLSEESSGEHKAKTHLRASLQRRLTMTRSSLRQSGHSSSEDTGEDVFLLKDNKKKSEVQAADKWWKFVFVFSLISMTACILTLWLMYPYGARMSTEEVATMPWSNGCIGLDSCICPRVSPACEIRFRRTL